MESRGRERLERMYFESHVTDADWDLVHQTEVTPLLTCAVETALLEAIDLFCQESVIPTTTRKQTDDRHKVFVGLFYRSLGFVKTAIALREVVYQQSLTSAERSVLEIYVDMELLHRNVVPDGLTKMLTWADWQKLKAARRVDEFYVANPELDTTPSEAAVHRNFIANNAALIEQKAAILWSDGIVPPKRLEHWTARNLPDRAKLLDKKFEALVLHRYDMRNFAVHTGLAGVMNLDKKTFEAMAAMSLNGIADCMLGELRIIGHELEMPQDVPHYFRLVKMLEEVRPHALANALLRKRDGVERFVIHRGDPKA